MTNVLMVEDDLVNFCFISKILTKCGGLDVKRSEDVNEVIQIARSGEADIILMDIRLPNSVYQGQSVDGVGITKILRRDPQTSNLPIVLLTCNAMEGDQEYFLEESGADGYITKPIIDFQRFIETIKGYITSKQTI